MAALGAVLVVAGLSLIDIRSVSLYQIDRTEAVLSALATLGVLAVGAVNGILFAVVLALLRVIKLMSRPRVEIWARSKVFQDFTRSSDMRAVSKSLGCCSFVSTRRSPFSTRPILNGR